MALPSLGHAPVNRHPRARLASCLTFGTESGGSLPSHDLHPALFAFSRRVAPHRICGQWLILRSGG